MLDLDHTLVNSARFGEVEPDLAARLEARLAADAGRTTPRERQLHRLPRIGMWTKLRPGAREFLEAAAELFELWIHTNGTRCGGGLLPQLSSRQPLAVTEVLMSSRAWALAVHTMT